MPLLKPAGAVFFLLTVCAGCSPSASDYIHPASFEIGSNAIPDFQKIASISGKELVVKSYFGMPTSGSSCFNADSGEEVCMEWDGETNLIEVFAIGTRKLTENDKDLAIVAADHHCETLGLDGIGPYKINADFSDGLWEISVLCAEDPDDNMWNEMVEKRKLRNK